MFGHAFSPPMSARSAGLFDPARGADPEHSGQLERCADRGPASGSLRRQSLAAQHLGKDIKIGFSNINAKAETVDTRPAFREAFSRRRCLVPFDRFYERKKLGKDREPLCRRARRIGA